MTEFSLDQLPPNWARMVVIARVLNCAADGDCWIWTGSSTSGRTSTRYGRIAQDGRTKYSHRVIYELLTGPIPDGLQLDHLCRVTLCCNPHHLEPVTCKVNVGRGSRGPDNVPSCPQGHDYTGENLREWTDSRGYTRRICRACQIENAHRWREERKLRQAATSAKYEGSVEVSA